MEDVGACRGGWENHHRGAGTLVHLPLRTHNVCPCLLAGVVAHLLPETAGIINRVCGLA
jgi:hypothetical protein